LRANSRRGQNKCTWLSDRNPIVLRKVKYWLTSRSSLRNRNSPHILFDLLINGPVDNHCVNFFIIFLDKADLANLDKYGDPIPGAENPNPDPSPIFSYLDLMCRLKNLSTVAGDFQKSLKKNNVAGLEDQAQVQKFWKALCLPRVDLSQISMKVIFYVNRQKSTPPEK
jgi:hypothetical protein